MDFDGPSFDFVASIFKRNSEVTEQVYSSMFDYTTAYKVCCVTYQLSENDAQRFFYLVALHRIP